MQNVNESDIYKTKRENFIVDASKQAQYWEGQKKRKVPVDPVIAAFVTPKLDYILKYAKLPERPLILDVGCGNGYFTYYLSELGTTIGLDFASAMLRMNPCKLLVQGSAFELPFSDNMFDMAFCSNLLHHLPELGAYSVLIAECI